MKSEEHIDKIVNKILKSRKIKPAKIRALAEVVKALSQVKEYEETPNLVKNQENESPESLFAPQLRDLSEVENMEIDGKKHPIKIVPS